MDILKLNHSLTFNGVGEYCVAGKMRVPCTIDVVETKMVERVDVVELYNDEKMMQVWPSPKTMKLGSSLQVRRKVVFLKTTRGETLDVQCACR